MRVLISTIWFCIFVAYCGTALSHEFWLEPERYQVAPGERIIADIRVGDKFKGPTNSYVKENFTRFEIIQAGKTTSVSGRLGDVPALAMAAPSSGLAVVAHETTVSNIRYYKWAKFSRFVHHKGFPDILDRHKARGLPETHFLERYSRHVKSLISVGNGSGSDVEVGMKTEFVAEANPYTDKLEKGLPIRLLLDGKPRSGTQVEIFARAPDGSVQVTLVKTDENGQAAISVSPGTEYLLDAVAIKPLEAEDPTSKPVWETFWAGMTFKIPAE